MFTRKQPRRMPGLLVAAAMYTICATAITAYAQGGSVPSLPTWQLVERSANSMPLGTVVIADTPALKNAPRENTIDLSRFGYVEEEYFISGTAKVYGSGAVAAGSAQSYVTRIIMRRPLDVYKFSGSVHMEPFADDTEQASTWTRAWSYFVEHGDVWIGVSVSKANIETMHKTYNAGRYGALSVPDDTMRWGILAQVAWLMRSPEGPLADLHYHDQAAIIPGLLRVYLSGWAHTGCVVAEFINGGHHQNNRRPNGRPVIDGYLSGSCPQVTPLSVPADAAVMQIMSESEYEGSARAVTQAARQPDGSIPLERRYRWYDVAGSSRAGYQDQPRLSLVAFQMGRMDQVSLNCTNPVSESTSMNEVARVSLRNLDEWIRIGYHPPEGTAFELNEDGTIKRDGDGNAIGGFRSRRTEVPTSTFVPSTDGSQNGAPESLGGACTQFGHERPFSSEYVEKLHGDRRAYVEKTTDALILLVNSRRMLEADADATLDQLRGADRR